MTLLSQVIKGKIRQPILALVYGPDGVGKSTLGAHAPNPIFLGTEKGTFNLNVSRFPSPNSFDQILQALDELLKESHDYQTLVIDSLDWMEPLVWEQVVFDQNNSKIKSIEDIGYSKGYIYALDFWRAIQGKLSALREARKMHILVIAHSHVKEAKDPTVISDYNRYQLKLHDKAAALWREYVDMVLFANFETLVAQDKAGKNRAFGNGARYLFTERRPAFDAKNRFGLPEKIEMSWEVMASLVESSNPQDPEILIRQVKSLLDEVKDDSLRSKVLDSVESAKTDSLKLERILNKVRTLIAA